MKPMSLQWAEQKLREAIDAGDLSAMDTYSELVDVLDSLHGGPGPTLGEAAYWYASVGLHVFPLAPRSKVPRKGSHGLDDATTDLQQVVRWWTMQPDANVGIATGHLVDVLDVDGEEGALSLSALLGARQPELDRQLAVEHDPAARDQHGRKPPTTRRLLLEDALGYVSTPRAGGAHFYFPARGQGNAAGLLPHIDRRGLGGYVVAPPSMTDVGSYRWVRLLDVSLLTLPTSAT